MVPLIFMPKSPEAPSHQPEKLPSTIPADVFNLEHHRSLTLAEKSYIHLSTRELRTPDSHELLLQLDELLGFDNGERSLLATISNVYDVWWQSDPNELESEEPTQPSKLWQTARRSAPDTTYISERLVKGDAISQAIKGEGTCLEWAMLLKVYAELYHFPDMVPSSAQILPTIDITQRAKSKIAHDHFAFAYTETTGEVVIAVFPGDTVLLDQIKPGHEFVRYVTEGLADFDEFDQVNFLSADFRDQVTTVVNAFLTAKRAYSLLERLQKPAKPKQKFRASRD